MEDTETHLKNMTEQYWNTEGIIKTMKETPNVSYNKGNLKNSTILTTN